MTSCIGVSFRSLREKLVMPWRSFTAPHGSNLAAASSARDPTEAPAKRPKVSLAYENDIFVSYAHVDNIPLSGVSKGWVETFIDNLSTKLAQKIGRTDLFKIWDDRLLASQCLADIGDPGCRQEVGDRYWSYRRAI